MPEKRLQKVRDAYVPAPPRIVESVSGIVDIITEPHRDVYLGPLAVAQFIEKIAATGTQWSEETLLLFDGTPLIGAAFQRWPCDGFSLLGRFWRHAD